MVPKIINVSRTFFNIHQGGINIFNISAASSVFFPKCAWTSESPYHRLSPQSLSLCSSPSRFVDLCVCVSVCLSLSLSLSISLSLSFYLSLSLSLSFSFFISSLSLRDESLASLAFCPNSRVDPNLNLQS